MKNYEFYKGEINKTAKLINPLSCSLHYLKENMDDCSNLKNCSECLNNSLNWLFEEYKEPIKLTRFEYDLLGSFDYDAVFGNGIILPTMKQKGYFKGVPDTPMTIKEILINSEVKDDD